MLKCSLPISYWTNHQSFANKLHDLLEQLPFFSNTTVASQLLLSSISALFANPFTIFVAFFVLLSKRCCRQELNLCKGNRISCEQLSPESNLYRPFFIKLVLDILKKPTTINSIILTIIICNLALQNVLFNK